MYQPILPLNTMVQFMNGQHMNGHMPHTQNHTLFVNGVGSYYPSEHTLCNDVTNYNRMRAMHQNHFSLYPGLMALEMQQIRRPNFSQHNSGANPNAGWTRRTNGVSIPPFHRNFNNNGNMNNNNRQNANSSMKKNWYNKNGKRNNTQRNGQENAQPKELQSSDSGFSSRSPTPNKSQIDDNLTESSDDRESILSQNEQTKRPQEPTNRSVNFVHNGMIPNASAHQYYPTYQQRPGNYFYGEAPLSRSPGQNFQNKRRSNNQGRSNSPQQRNQRNHEYVNANQVSITSLPRYPHVVDYYYDRATLTVARTRPEYLLNGSIWDDLSEDIWNKFIANQQSEETFKNKMMLWKKLLICIKAVFPKYNLFMVGSTMNGFGSNSSDVDMCLVVRNTELSPRNEAISHLSHLLECLGKIENIQQPELIQAKVPILKFRDSKHNLEIDLNCNNSVGIRNTHLLYCYSRIDYRVRPLVLIVKLWAQAQNINDAKNMTISSYSLVLMVIHFLQCGANPSILPCLHLLYKGKFEPMSDIHQINIHEELDYTTKQLPPLNRQSLGELLVQFFKYYSTFDFIQYAISVRLARKIPVEECRQVRTPKNDPHQWKYLCIEEPFDQTNTARSVYDPEVFEKIKKIIRLSYERLNETRKLASIFTRLIPDAKSAT